MKHLSDLTTTISGVIRCQNFTAETKLLIGSGDSFFSWSRYSSYWRPLRDRVPQDSLSQSRHRSRCQRQPAHDVNISSHLLRRRVIRRRSPAHGESPQPARNLPTVS
jgi:hypothetical protein